MAMSFSFTITINGQALDKKSAEVAFIERTLQLAATEISAGRGTKTSGSIIGISPAGTPNTSLGSWSYTAGATNP